MRIALAQLNPTVGDIAGNTALVLDAIKKAKSDRADVLVTSELVLIGYPPRDLLLREGIVEACEEAVLQIAEAAGELHVIVGHPRKCAGGIRPLRNSASVCHRGRVIAVCDKQLLPGYDVFDEDRYFEPGGRSCAVRIHDRNVGIVICEDLWRANDVMAERRYLVEPVAELAALECDLVISLNASPFVLGKWQRHIEQMSEGAADLHVPIVAVNQVGANDDLIFDGRSIVVAACGVPQIVLEGFRDQVRTVEVSKTGEIVSPVENSECIAFAQDWWSQPHETFEALSCGVRDYCRKTGHTQVLIGLSGGIDSALTAVIAVEALGAEHVHGVMMPSRYSSPGSIEDSQSLAKRLGLASCREMSIESIHNAMQQSLQPQIAECATSGLTDENVQARLRGIMLMALSNATPNSLVLSTSNKSEIATGYSTLYGDMCGAIAVLGDVTKTRIYQLARWINANHAACGFAIPPIPENSLAKPPSAELRPNQTDQDTLPPYEVLDQIIERFIEREQSAQTIIAESGIDRDLVLKTLKMIDRAQYKRGQAPVIPKVSPRAFGPGRPMPIVMKQAHKASNQPSGNEHPRAGKSSAKSQPVESIKR
jgi:NAD+ synthase (glutamine-hydrolysing)